MAYFLFGLAVGSFMYGLICAFSKEKSSWINPLGVFLISGITFVLSIYWGWFILQRAFS